MSYKGKSVLAVVPARGGSKGIKHKNLQKLAGKSLVGRAAEIAKSIGWIDRAIITSDDEAIIDEATKYGLEAPFVRPAELSHDSALSVDVWIHAWEECEKVYNEKYDISVLLEPTSPLRTEDDIERTVKLLIDGGHAASATVSPTPAHYTPHKTLTVSKSGEIGFYNEGGEKYSIRQNIPNYYHRNGICYAVTKECLIENKSIIETDCAAVIIDRPIVNIDEPFELKLAEWLLSNQSG